MKKSPKKNLKKNLKKKTKKTSNHKKKGLVIGLFIAGAVLIVILFLLILSDIGAFKKPNEVEMFSVQDECALVMGNLIRQIIDEGSCKIRCDNECDVRNMEFDSFEFVAQNNSCHICNCYCK